jgi:tripartite-type tricarboxylate transporter receptor subunit TctC
MALCGVALASAAPAHADSAADFFRGKTITIYCGSDVGGGYDLVARTVARYLGRHTPGNPNVIVQNRPGAASVVAANFVYSVAPKDGTALALVQRSIPFQQLFSGAGVRYDATKIRWIGSTSSEFATVTVWHTAPQQTFDDVFKMETIVGSVGVAGDTDLYPRVLNNTLDTKFKIVGGYPGQAQIILAMERGELQGTGYWSWPDIENRRADWLRDKKIRPLLQLGFARSASPYLRNVPLITDLARNDEQRDVFMILMSMLKMGRPFFAPPEVPQDRTEALRAAFMDTMRDQEFVNEAEKTIGTIDPMSGSDMQRMISDIYQLPDTTVKSLRNAVK